MAKRRIMKYWKYDEIEKILTSTADSQTLAEELGRTPESVTITRNLAEQWKQKKTKNVSKSLMGHFERYYVNKGDMQLEEQIPTNQEPEQTVAQTDTCEQEIDTLEKNIENTYEMLKSQLTTFAQLLVDHGNHEVREENKRLKQEIEVLKGFKSEAEPELEQLRVLRNTAQQSNFGNMLRVLRGKNKPESTQQVASL